MSRRELRDDRCPIALLAVGCVPLTTFVVAAAGRWIVDLPRPVAFVLGAVVSPPGVVAPIATARRLGVPSRITTVLEGEGLVNDVTALILLRSAIAAVGTGTFSICQATGEPAAIVAGEALYGAPLIPNAGTTATAGARPSSSSRSTLLSSRPSGSASTPRCATASSAARRADASSARRSASAATGSGWPEPSIRKPVPALCPQRHAARPQRPPLAAARMRGAARPALPLAAGPHAA